MNKDKITYKTLRHIQEVEKSTPGVSKIDEHFYYDVNLYLEDLQGLLEKEKDAERVKLLNNEIQNIKRLVMSIYEQREKKIVHAALSASRGGKPDIRNLIEPERRLYDNLISSMQSMRDETLKTTTRQEITVKKEESREKTAGDKDAALVNKKEETIKDEVDNDEPNMNPIVQVLVDIPSFVGTDMRTYNLKKDDVLSLNSDMSNQFIKRKVMRTIK